jgi:pimeloyl-ACP methyl ester carboxylesterase
MPELTVGGLELYYEEHGTGAPLLLIGGLGLAVAEIQPLIEAFAAAGYRVIAADNRGAGRSAKPPGPYTIEQMAGDLAGLAAKLGLSRAHVLGISMGGRVALALGLDHPDLVDHLVLVSAGARPGPGRGRVRLGMALSGLPLLRGHDPQPRPAIQAQFEAVSRFDVTGRLAEITQPTLIVHGHSDRIAPAELAQELHDLIPGAQRAELSGGHYLALLPHRRDELVGVVRQFLPPG